MRSITFSISLTRSTSFNLSLFFAAQEKKDSEVYCRERVLSLKKKLCLHYSKSCLMTPGCPWCFYWSRDANIISVSVYLTLWSSSSPSDQTSSMRLLNKSFVTTPLEKAMAPHSSTLAWKIPWMEEPGRLQSMGSRRVDWATSLSLFTFHFHALEKEMATHSSVLAWTIPGTGEPGGLPSVGSHRVGHDWRDLAAAAAAATPWLSWNEIESAYIFTYIQNFFKSIYWHNYTMKEK